MRELDVLKAQPVGKLCASAHRCVSTRLRAVSLQAGHSKDPQDHLAGFCCRNSSFVMGDAAAGGARQARQSMLVACRNSATGASCSIGTCASWPAQSAAAAAAAAAVGPVRRLLRSTIAMIVAVAIRSAQYNRFVARLQRLLHAAPCGMHTAAAVSDRRRSHATCCRSCAVNEAQQPANAGGN